MSIEKRDALLAFLGHLAEATWDAARFIRYAELAINPDAPVGSSIANPISRVCQGIGQAIRMERGRRAKEAKP